MLKLFTKAPRLVTPLTRTPLRFSGTDWAKEREKAAEKEYAIREEKEKMKKLRSKVAEGKTEVKLHNPLEDVDQVEVLLQDREYLVVG